MSKKHMGSSIEGYLKAEGILEAARAEAIEEVAAWQLAEAMKAPAITRNAFVSRRRREERRSCGSDAPCRWP